MAELSNQKDQNITASDAYEGLRQAILRLTSSSYETLQGDIQSLSEQISAIEAIRARIENVQKNLSLRDDELSQQNQELRELVEEAKLKIGNLETHFLEINASLQENINANVIQFESDIAILRALFDNPQEISNRISPLLIPLIALGARQDQDEFAEAVAPVIGPAIRHQIRAAKQDIIDALFPLIGEIIGKAIAESFRELTRKIDARLRGRLDFRSRFNFFLARLRGVSDAELLMRQALPYAIHHIFLIHRKSGLLLQHIAVSDDQAEDSDLISGMLTAIRDFVRDSFGNSIVELEEIAYGDERILLEGGQHAYLAVVLNGVEPAGFNLQLQDVITKIHLQHEESLRHFDGNMERVPDFGNELAPIITPERVELETQFNQDRLSRRQRLFILGAAIGILLFIGLVIFACVFTIRLWPLAFPA